MPTTLCFSLVQLLWLTGNAWFLLLAGGAAGSLLVGVLSRARLDGLTIEVSHHPRVSVGDELPAVLTVTNAGTRLSSETQLCLHTAGLADLVVSVGRLSPGERVSVPVSRAATTRAVGDGSVARLVARPGLGLVVAWRRVDVLDHVTVHPRLHDVPVLAGSERVGSGDAGSAVRAHGPEVLGVEEWRAGGDHRRVHWRSTARTGRLTLLERGDAVTSQLDLVLVGSDGSPGFEEALSAAASTCDRALRAGHRVMAVAWHSDGPVLAPAQSRWELLDWWSSVHDTVLPDAEVFGAAVRAGFGGGSVVLAGPADPVDEWFAGAARACPGMLLHRLQAVD